MSDQYVYFLCCFFPEVKLMFVGFQNAVIMGLGLVAIAGCMGYIAYMKSKYESMGYYSAVKGDGTEQFLKRKSKWDQRFNIKLQLFICTYVIYCVIISNLGINVLYKTISSVIYQCARNYFLFYFFLIPFICQTMKYVFICLHFQLISVKEIRI